MENVTVRVPARVEDGTVLRVTGGGEAGERGSTPGDLAVVIHVRPDSRFERDGDNLVTERHVSTPGGSGRRRGNSTLEKPIKIHVPAGTQSGGPYCGCAGPARRPAGDGERGICSSA
ncbi:MAG: hypothetical protein IPP09_09445 [Elusimicrobia bacterium]|nr:hypothetical protein [Elusimicrobiota bacterium]